MTEKTSKVAIVTGASRGIGAAVAERLAGDGFTVVVNYSGDVKSAEALTARIEGNGGRALPFKADVSDPKAVREMFDKTASTFGGIDVLISRRNGLQRWRPATMPCSIGRSPSTPANTMRGAASARGRRITFDRSSAPKERPRLAG